MEVEAVTTTASSATPSPSPLATSTPSQENEATPEVLAETTAPVAASTPPEAVAATRVRVKRKLQFTSCYEFKKIWDDSASSAAPQASSSSSGNVTFFRVKPPKGFSLLGDYAEPALSDLPNNPSSFFAVREHVRKLEEPVLEGEAEPEDFPLLAKPKEFVPVLNDKTRVSLWRPVPPSDDYVALGHVATEPERTDPPDVSSISCVHKSVLSVSKQGYALWSDRKGDAAVWVILPPLRETFFHPSTFFALSSADNANNQSFYYFHRQPLIEVLGVSLSPFKIIYGELAERVQHPDTGFHIERKKKALKALKNSSKAKYFTGASAVEWLVKEYGLKSRKEAVVLGENLRRSGLFSRKDEPSRPFVDDHHAYYKFEEGFSSSPPDTVKVLSISTDSVKTDLRESGQTSLRSSLRPTAKVTKAGSNLSLLSYTNGRLGNTITGLTNSRVQSTSNVNSMNLMSSSAVSVTTNPLLAKRGIILADRGNGSSPITMSGSHIHPAHHQHINQQPKGQKGKFMSLTKHERERYAELIADAGLDGTQSAGAKKKDGILKHTIRGLVKPKSNKSGSSDDAPVHSDKDPTPTKGSSIAGSPAASPSPPSFSPSPPSQTPVKKGRLFGAALDAVVAQEDLASDTYAMPRFVEHALAFLEREENIVTLGLFRIAAKKPDIDVLRATYDDGGTVDMVATEVHPHTVAGVLKQFLRSLPETPLTTLLYPRFLEAAREDAELIKSALKELLGELPEINYILLERLVHFFTLLTARSEENKMTASNIGALIGPNLVRRDEADPQELFKETNTLNSMVEFLITHHATLFERTYLRKEPRPPTTPALDSIVSAVISEALSTIDNCNDEASIPTDDSKNEASESTQSSDSAATPGDGVDKHKKSTSGESEAEKVQPEKERVKVEGVEEWEGSEDEGESLDDFVVPAEEPAKKKAHRLLSKKKSNIQAKIESSPSKAEEAKRTKRSKKEAKKEKKKEKKEKKKKGSIIKTSLKESATSILTRLASSDGISTRVTPSSGISASPNSVPASPAETTTTDPSRPTRRSRGDSFIRRGSIGSLFGRPLSASFQPEDIQIRFKRQSVEVRSKPELLSELDEMHRAAKEQEGQQPQQPQQPQRPSSVQHVIAASQPVSVRRHGSPSQSRLEDSDEIEKQQQRLSTLAPGLHVEKDLVRLRKGTLEQMMEEVRELEVMRITKLVREKEVEEVKKINKVTIMKEIKEKEIQEMAERDALERELKRRERRKSSLLVQEIVHKMFTTEPKPIDTEQVAKERKAQNNREFFEKKITEVKGKTKEEIEAEVRMEAATGKKNVTLLQQSGVFAGGSKDASSSSTSSTPTSKAIASKLALFEQTSPPSPPEQ